MKFHCISHEIKLNIASYEIIYMYTDIHTYIVFLYVQLKINHISDYFTEQCLENNHTIRLHSTYLFI